MKYTMVKQFSNASIDNIFKFFFKIIDLGKIFVELFWGIFDIFAAFYLIFFNFFMYFYYLFLFAIDRGSETSGPTSYRARKSSGRIKSKIPKLTITSTPNPIPAMYRVKEAASSTVSKVAETTADIAQTAVSPVISSKSGGAKKGFIKPAMEFIVEVLITLKNMIFKPFGVIANFFSERLKPVREGGGSTVSESQSKKSSPERSSGGSSLIDEYMKEYRRGRK